MESSTESADCAQESPGPGDLSVESTKQLLERLLTTKSERLTIKNNEKGKNKFIWSQFDIAYVDGAEQQYAVCKYCKSFVKYTGRTGTGGLMRHFCFKKFLSLQEEQRANLEAHPEEIQATETDKVPLRLQIETLIHQKSPRIGYIPNYKGKSGVWSQFYMITLDNSVVNFACCITCHSIVTYYSRTGTGSMTRHKCQKKFKSYLTGFGPDFQPPIKRRRPNDSDFEDHPMDIKTEDSNDWEQKKIKEEDEDSSDAFNGDLYVDVSLKDKEDSNRSPSPSRSLTSFLLDNLTRRPEDRVPENVEHAVQEKYSKWLKKSLNVFHNTEFLEFAQTLVDLGAKYGKIDVREIFKGKTDLSDLLRRTK